MNRTERRNGWLFPCTDMDPHFQARKPCRTFRDHSSHACAQAVVLPKRPRPKQTQLERPNECLHGCPQRSIFVTLAFLLIRFLTLTLYCDFGKRNLKLSEIMTHLLRHNLWLLRVAFLWLVLLLSFVMVLIPLLVLFLCLSFICLFLIRLFLIRMFLIPLFLILLFLILLPIFMLLLCSLGVCTLSANHRNIKTRQQSQKSSQPAQV